MRGDFLWLRPVRPHVRPSSRGGRGPHARAVRGRHIRATKVKALPESLGRCKLLETLCVPPAALPLFAFAAVPARRCCASAAAPGARSAPRGVVCGGVGVAGRGRAHLRVSGARGRPARFRGWAGAARHGRTVGAQVRVQHHRARGAAGSGRLAKPEGTVSAPAATLTRPADAPTRGRAESGARARRARLGTCVCTYVCT
jgi:hypothetical protein